MECRLRLSARRQKASIDRRPLAEAARCRLLCANCHAEVENGFMESGRGR